MKKNLYLLICKRMKRNRSKGIISGNTIKWNGHNQKGTTKKYILINNEKIKYSDTEYCTKCGKSRFYCKAICLEKNTFGISKYKQGKKHIKIDYLEYL